MKRSKLVVFRQALVGLLAAALLVVCAACSNSKTPADQGGSKAPAGQNNTAGGASNNQGSDVDGKTPTGGNNNSAGGAKQNPPTAPSDKPTDKPSDKPSDKPVAPDVREQGKAVLQALKAKDMKKIAALAHPDKGVRFSPYGFIDTKHDLVFKPAALEKLFSDDQVYEWGKFEGSGEPIKLKFADYYAKFVYDADFENPQKSSVNEIIGKGNLKNNITEVYPAAQYVFVEYHFSGFDKQYAGQDWKSLRLVFEKAGNKLYLVGIIHDQWTP